MRSPIGDPDAPIWPVHGVTPITPGWRFVSIGFEGEPTDVGGGIDPWKVTWTSTHGRIVVAHPSYPNERHTMFTYEVADTDPPVVFAAGEYSNLVYGFYVPVVPS
jgi:hypothetical protein